VELLAVRVLLGIAEVRDDRHVADQPEPDGQRPARGSTIGSVSTIAPPPEPATTAPLAYAASTASKTNEPFSTERAWSEEPPGCR